MTAVAIVIGGTFTVTGLCSAVAATVFRDWSLVAVSIGMAGGGLALLSGGVAP